MNESLRRGRFAILMVSVCIALMGGSAFAKTTPEMVKQEEGYYYGYAKADTLDQAMLEAKRDLVETALTAAVRVNNAKAPRVKVTEASAKARLEDVKPFVQTKAKVTPASVTYRIKNADWDKLEKKYSDKLRAELAPRVADLANKRTVADKISEALDVLSRLVDEGETSLLTEQDGGTELLSRRLESVCNDAAKTVKLTLNTKDGFVGADTKFAVKAADGSGNGMANIPLSISWDVSTLPTDAASTEVEEVLATAKTDSLGNATVEFPLSEEYRNRPVTLTVTTDFSTSLPSSTTLKKLDAASTIDGCYVYYDDLNATYATVTIPAGTFNAGAVPQDTRAGGKEAAHEATTGSYAIDVGPVTNAQYAAFIHATRAETMPEYFDNPDYNQGKQPVVGVSYADAEAYAAWLSEQTGRKYRLPTEEEWEKAARGGKDTVYPWGDSSPADGKNANYKGNGTFEGPSPVGSFDNGKNEWGLADMCGNVWEWTSSTHSKDPASTSHIVKGGSWMDGPTDLRISNSRDVDGLKGYPDVGFRLVMEVSE
jgi:formylglycine-generating enzyme required for sulfatase activity